MSNLRKLFLLRGDRLDAPEEDTTPNIRRFFKLLGRRFWKLVSLNLMMLPMVLPVMIAVFIYLGIEKTPVENTVIFSQLYGAQFITQTPETTFLLDIFGAQGMIPIYHPIPAYLGIGACILFLAATFGWQNVGCTYILRSMVRGEPTFLFTDYIYAVKRNLKQGFFLGLLDFAILFLLGFDFLYFWGMTGKFKFDLMFFAVFALGILYFFMRFYLYLMQITFEMSVRKMFKNALIFSVLGVKRNLMAVLWIIVITSINIALIAVFLPLNFALPLILPFIYYFAICAFTTAFAAYPVIDRYMIAPYVKPESEETSEPSEE